MIRRDIVDTAGRPAWALISQVEHARIAGEMAAAWSGTVAALPEAREEFLAAVYHHDDGWLPWELRPPVVDGRPREFLEMPIDEALAIWRRSIAVALNYGVSSAYAVSGHFAALCRRAHDEKPHDDSWRHLAEEFLDEQTQLQAEWRAQVAERSESPTAAQSQLDRGVHGLQFFDLLSLWLSCARRNDADEITVADFCTLRATPRRSEGDAAEILVEPWPFDEATLELSLPVKAVPRADYATDDALAQALQSPAVAPTTLRFRLVSF